MTTTEEKPEYRYSIARRDGDPTSVMVLIDGGDTLIASSEMTQFPEIVTALEQGARLEEVRNLFDLSEIFKGAFETLSERIMVKNGMIYFDGDPMEDSLGKTIVRFKAAGHKDYTILVKFAEKIMTNPSDRSRKQLFNWMIHHDVAISPEGDMVVYKKVNARGTDPDDMTSVSQGHGFVNGKEYVNSSIPNRPGTIVSMPRSEVDDDPFTACSSGLHAANWRYARNFGGNQLIRVQINPRDVVSVPEDSNCEKIRCCRYQVLGPVSAEDTDVLYVERELGTLALPQRKQVTTIAKPVLQKLADGISAITGKKKPAPRKSKTVSAEQAPERKAPAKPTKKAAVKKAAEPKASKQKFYEDMTAAEFSKRTIADLRWLAGDWELEGVTSKTTKPVLVDMLVGKAQERTAIRQKNKRLKMTTVK